MTVPLSEKMKIIWEAMVVFHHLVLLVLVKSKFQRAQRTSDAWRRSGVFIVNFECISHLLLVFLLLTLNM